MSERLPKPVPVATPETAPFWEGCLAGELRLQRCVACTRTQFPPRRYCAGCLSDELSWERASGLGRIRSYTVVRVPTSPAFADEVPYVVALVELEEGPTLLSGIRGCDPDEVQIGLAVEVEFERRGEGVRLPYFHPC